MSDLYLFISVAELLEGVRNENKKAIKQHPPSNWKALRRGGASEQCHVNIHQPDVQ